MGRYADKLKYEQTMSAIDTALNDETANGKIGSLKEVLNLLSATNDGTTKLAEVINTAITTAITAACAENGAVDTAINAKITAAVAADGAVDTAIDAKITAGIGTDGAIETWADGRYEPKTT